VITYLKNFFQSLKKIFKKKSKQGIIFAPYISIFKTTIVTPGYKLDNAEKLKEQYKDVALQLQNWKKIYINEKEKDN
jgi:hypothetical protein